MLEKEYKIVDTFHKYTEIKTFRDALDNQLTKGYYSMMSIFKNMKKENDYTALTIYEDVAKWFERHNFVVTEVKVGDMRYFSIKA